MQQRRFEFWQLMPGLLVKDLIFIDEFGINLAFTRCFARSPKGQRARGVRPQKRGQNVSLIGALGLNGLMTHVSLLGATDGLTLKPSSLNDSCLNFGLVLVCSWTIAPSTKEQR